MEQLVDFLNHGILPFTGRLGEVDRIVAFWRGTFTAQELRAAVVIGEAGIGKSRLITESIPCIGDAGGMVIHTKLYPESATSIIMLVARELWYNESVRRLLKVEPEATVTDVADALRRVSMLRPTLLVIEDIHLLSGDALREFSMLMNALAEETLSLLCTARPVELPARTILERFIVEEIPLAGLTSGEIEDLWTRLLCSSPEPGILVPLAELTGGNPLALRSALRSSIKNETLVHDQLTNSWRSSIPPDSFEKILRRNVSHLTEAMVSHLTDEERSAARSIASLGEIFARESAGLLITDAPAMLHALAYKGVIATSEGAMPPLPGECSNVPLLVFTHTLLHQYLLDSCDDLPGQLARALASGAPLYSTVPLQVLKRNIGALDMEPEELLMLVHRITEIAIRISSGPLWGAAAGILEVATAVVRTFHARWNECQRRESEAYLLNAEINLQNHSFDRPEFHALVERQMELTSNPATERMALLHLWALRFLYVAIVYRDYSRHSEIWEKVERFLEAFPVHRGSQAYVTFLREAAQAALRIPDLAMLRMVESRVESLLASEELSRERRADATQLAATQFLQLFDNEEELARRIKFLRDLPRSAFDRDPTLLLRKMELLGTTGRIAEVLAVPADTWQHYLNLRLFRSAFNFRMFRTVAEGATGIALEAIERKIFEARDAICAHAEEVTERAATAFLRNCAIHLSEVGALRGDLQWTRDIMRKLAPGEPCFWPEVELMLAAERGTLGEIVNDLPEEESYHTALKVLAHLAAGSREADQEKAMVCAMELLRRPILNLDDILALHTTATLLCSIDEGSEKKLPATGEEIAGEVAHALDRGLRWLAERSITAYMLPVLERYGRFIPKKEAARWRSEIKEIEKRSEGTSSATDGNNRLRIRMIGTIAAGAPGEELRPIRGPRLKTVLGLLTAARMLPEPLSNTEFCHIAAGGELDIDLARKTANMAVVRLRETIGTDMIVTGEETHELNMDRVQVDLLDAHALLAEATDALKNRAPMRAYPALLKALDLTNGDVPFPGLYDDFFEAIRGDFESSLRATLVALANFLLREKDTESAERLLRRGFEVMPEDEEIADLLRQALVELGQRTDAERIRIRAQRNGES